MADVGGVGGNRNTPPSQNQIRDGAPATPQPDQGNSAQQPVGQPGLLGQPTGLPVGGTDAPQPAVLTDVLAGRDASQLNAAEQMRTHGGVSATEELLGLNLRPTMAGALPAPPGNSEALRHMTPAMRRAVLRGVLDKQRDSLRRLAHLLRREQDEGQRQPGDAPDERDGEGEASAQESLAELSTLDQTRVETARGELAQTARMLDLLDELLLMQDYAISHMGTFSQG